MTGIPRVLTHLLKFAVTCKFYDNVENSPESVTLPLITHVSSTRSFNQTSSHQGRYSERLVHGLPRLPATYRKVLEYLDTEHP
jgi:hypothetical protein